MKDSMRTLELCGPGHETSSEKVSTGPHFRPTEAQANMALRILQSECAFAVEIKKDDTYLEPLKKLSFEVVRSFLTVNEPKPTHGEAMVAATLLQGPRPHLETESLAVATVKRYLPEVNS